MKTDRKQLLQHLGIIVSFIVISFIYFYPVLEGKSLHQGDVMQAKGMQSEMNDHYEKTGEFPLWTNSMFSGMPTYQIYQAPAQKYNIFHKISKYVRLGLPKHTVGVMFLYMICFYIMLIIFGVNRRLAMIGAILFGLSSYNVIIIAAGHVNKALAIAILPLLLGGLYLIFQRKYLWGFIISVLSIGLELAFNHVQMTYYAYLLIGVYLLVKLVESIIHKYYKQFAISTSFFILATFLALLPNITNIWITNEYSKETIRHGSELQDNDLTSGKGLDKDYALNWSYGQAESLSLLIPNIHGGSSRGGGLDKESNTYQALINQGVPTSQAQNMIQNLGTYWGNQPFTDGPVYFGAIVVFLFVLGLFLIKGPIKIWLFIGALFSIFLAMGKNFEILTNIFFNYFPLYNKFRAVSSILIIASLAFPLLGLITLHKIYYREYEKEKFIKSLKYALGIVGGICLLILLFAKTMFSFHGAMDQQYLSAGYPQWLIDALIDDRVVLLRKDCFRSLFFIIVTAGFIYFYHTKKLKPNYLILGVGLLAIIDIWTVDKRYVSAEEFTEKEKAQEIQPNRANLQIMQDSDPHFRVFNVTSSPFQEAYTSYFHKSIGGYHGAKLARYQDIIEHHLSKQNMDVLNMLNTKYFIVQGENKQPQARLNSGALGNAWFVNKINWVSSPRESIETLNNFDPSNEAIIDKKYESYINANEPNIEDSLAPKEQINLIKYEPDYLKYESQTNEPRLAVFSEVYYNDEKGWKVYIDGKETQHIRVNYILRAITIPEGTHEIEFRFEPPTFYKAQKIAGISSIFVLLLILGAIIKLWRDNAKK